MSHWTLASVSGLPLAEASGRDTAYETTGLSSGGQSKQSDQAGGAMGLYRCQEKGGRRQRELLRKTKQKREGLQGRPLA